MPVAITTDQNARHGGKYFNRHYFIYSLKDAYKVVLVS